MPFAADQAWNSGRTVVGVLGGPAEAVREEKQRTEEEEEEEPE